MFAESALQRSQYINMLMTTLMTTMMLMLMMIKRMIMMIVAMLVIVIVAAKNTPLALKEIIQPSLPWTVRPSRN